MLHDWLGDIKFRCGLSGYLERFSYGNAETKDLWKALEKSSEKPVGMVMATWTRQKGYPLIIVSNVKVDLVRKETTLFISSMFSSINIFGLLCKIFLNVNL
jgi:aminopeptidase N